MSAPAISVLVIGGYLGSGKTTLVNHLLREGTGRRTMVLVNDFGALAIDEELVASRDGNVITLTNGCVCCSMSAPLVETLQQIRTSVEPPELLVIETSGVADPLPVAHHAMVPGFELDGIVVVLDAETVRRRAADDLVGRSISRQLKAAHVLVLNKTDLVAPETVSTIRGWLAERAPEAAVIEAAQARAPIPLLFKGASLDLRDESGADAAHDEHVTRSWTAEGPLDRARFVDAIVSAPDGIVRAKGIVHFTDEPVSAVQFQLVGRRWSLDALADDRATSDTSRIVVIALPGTSADEIDAFLTQIDQSRAQ